MRDRFRKGDNDNILYVTSLCTNHCIMCCQPPKKVDDSIQLFESNKSLIENAEKDTDYICITGGEPTTIGPKLFSYMKLIEKHLPDATIHLLTNGKTFSDASYLVRFKSCCKNKIILGIPFHSDNCVDHDRIAGAKGAFFQTLKGLHNLSFLNYEIELRVILIKQNTNRLPQIADFITRNLPFVSQVSFMGLEIIGLADKNYPMVWHDPMDYTKELRLAIEILSDSLITPRIFNIPLCLLQQDMWQYACKSISTWKATYLLQCRECQLRTACCGVFSTSKCYSPHIKPFR